MRSFFPSIAIKQSPIKQAEVTQKQEDDLDNEETKIASATRTLEQSASLVRIVLACYIE
jgi:hypothetical protein